jgi:O-antigen/teichoic acid export membrane protein
MQSRTFRAAVLAFGNVLTSLVGVASLAVLVRVLSVQEYATYRQVVLTYAFVTPLLTFGLPQSLYYYLPGAGERGRGVVLDNLLVLTAAGIAVFIALMLGGNGALARYFGNTSVADALMVMAAYPIFVLPLGSVNACLVARGLAGRAAAFTVASRLVQLGSVIVAALVWRSAHAAAAAMVLGAAVTLPAGVALMLGATQGPFRVTFGGIQEQLRFAAPVGITTAIGTAAATLDKLVVSGSCTAAEFATYANGSMEVPLVGMLTGSAMSVLLPEMSSLCKEGRAREALHLWQRAAVKSALGLFPAFVALMILGTEFVTTLYSVRYADSVPVFRVILLMLPLRIVYFGAVLMAAGRGKMLLLTSSIGLGANLALSIPLVRIFGPIGAAWATVISVWVFQVGITISFIVRTYRVPFSEVLPFRTLGRIATACCAASAVLVPTWYGTPGSPVVRLVVFGVAYCAAVVLLFSYVGLLDVRSAWARIRGLVAARGVHSDPAGVGSSRERLT